MILDDFTMLGTTVPEPTRADGRVFVCSAGISPELGSLVRIYPLARHTIPTRWHTYRVPVERNPKDSRRESFKVRGDRTGSAHAQINDQFAHIGVMPATARAAILAKHEVASIAEANARRLSLAIIKPQILGIAYEHNPESPDSPLLTLFDINPRPTEGAKRFPYIPRLRFSDEGGDHALMLRDWGCFEWMRKYPDRYTELPNCLHLSGESSLLIGNFNQHRTSWLVISVLNGLRESALFDFDGVAS